VSPGIGKVAEPGAVFQRAGLLSPRDKNSRDNYIGCFPGFARLAPQQSHVRASQELRIVRLALENDYEVQCAAKQSVSNDLIIVDVRLSKQLTELSKSQQMHVVARCPVLAH
jgi:hypothetical protein